jgi:hypothetical protein
LKFVTKPLSGWPCGILAHLFPEEKMVAPMHRIVVRPILSNRAAAPTMPGWHIVRLAFRIPLV